jgi:hypothetical protein
VKIAVVVRPSCRHHLNGNATDNGRRGMRRTAVTAIAAVIALAGGAASAAEPADGVRTIPLEVKLDWQSFDQRVNGVHLDCRIFDGQGERVGHGTRAGRIDPAFLSRRGRVETTMTGFVVMETAPAADLTCSCEARFDTRSIFFRSGDDDFGRRPFMFYRPLHRARTQCEPAMAQRRDESS